MFNIKIFRRVLVSNYHSLLLSPLVQAAQSTLQSQAPYIMMYYTPRIKRNL